VQALRFLVRYPDGRGEDFTIEAERVMIGSGAHCEIRLSVDQAATEHVEVSVGPDAALAEARAFEPHPTINGVPFQRTQMFPDAVLTIGQVHLKVAVVDVGEQQAVVPTQREKTSPLAYVGAVVGLFLAGYLLLNMEKDAPTRQPDSPPPLWGDPIASCPVSGQAEALAHATEQYRQAMSRRERRAFYIQDGVKAVPLFEVVAACYAAAGEQENAAVAKDAAQKLRTEVDGDYRTHRVRLEHALSVKDWATVQLETRILLSYTEGIQSDYVTSLSNLDRSLQLKYGGKKKP